MKKSELEKKLKDLDSAPADDRLYRLNKLHLEATNDFNEKAKYYLRSIYVLAWIILAVLAFSL